jgi:hypothetical protein
MVRMLLSSIARRYGAALSMLAVLVGALWTLGVYVDDRISKAVDEARRQEREERQLVFEVRKEFQKPFYQRQMDLCLEASDAAAVLATTTDAAKSRLASDTFWRLYWGQLVAIEEKEDNSATGLVGEMVKFGGMLRTMCPALPCSPKAQRCQASCAAEADPPACLQCSSLALARACRRLIAESWQLPSKP